LKINDLFTRDSREFPAPDPLVIPGYKPDSRRFETGSIPGPITLVLFRTRRWDEC